MAPYPIMNINEANDVLYFTVKNYGQTLAINLHGGVSVVFSVQGRDDLKFFSIQREVVLALK